MFLSNVGARGQSTHEILAVMALLSLSLLAGELLTSKFPLPPGSLVFRFFGLREGFSSPGGVGPHFELARYRQPPDRRFGPHPLPTTGNGAFCARVARGRRRTRPRIPRWLLFGERKSAVGFVILELLVDSS